MHDIYLVRHGQCEDNVVRILNGHRDSPLTALGKRQALAAAKKLAKANIKAIYTSPLRRTLETARIIGQELGIELIHMDQDLAERDFGVLTGHHVSDIPKFAKTIEKINGLDYFFDGRGVEGFPAVYKRASEVLARIKHQTAKRGNVLVVTHGDTGMMMVAAAKGWGWYEGIHKPFWKNGEIIKIN